MRIPPEAAWTPATVSLQRCWVAWSQILPLLAASWTWTHWISGLEPDGQAIPQQRPFAAVIGCSDARVPIELVFNEGPNDLFVIRVAGNGLGGDVLGSLKYAVEHLSGSLRLVVILAHSGCGALTAAVDVFLEPAAYLALATQHALRNILDRQLIVVQACAKTLIVFRRGKRTPLGGVIGVQKGPLC